MMALLVPFAIYYLLLGVICFLVVSQGHDALYDEPPPGMGSKVALGSLILALMLTNTHSTFATMFTDDIGKTVIQAILWFGVFALIFRFQPWHALGIGLVTMLITSGLATMAVDSMLIKTPTDRYETKAIATPVRRPAFGGASGVPAAGAGAAPAQK